MRPVDAFQEMLSRWIAPALREQGFSRRGSTFHLREEGNWGMINVQRSQTSTADQVSFTVNLGVASRRLMAFWQQPAEKRPSVWDCHWRERIGFLLPARQDRWWTIDADTPPHTVAQEVRDATVSLAVPEVRRNLSDEALRDLWLAGRSPGTTDIQRLLYLSVLLQVIGPVERLDAVIAELRAKSAGQPVAATVAVHLDRLAST